MPRSIQSCHDSSGLCRPRMTETSTVLTTSPSCKMTLPVPTPLHFPVIGVQETGSRWLEVFTTQAHFLRAAE